LTYTLDYYPKLVSTITFTPVAGPRLGLSEAADPDLAADVAPTAVGNDPDYATGGQDSVIYQIDGTQLHGEPMAVRASLCFQSISPFYLQDRFCSSKSEDTQCLYYLTGHLNLEDSAA